MAIFPPAALPLVRYGWKPRPPGHPPTAAWQMARPGAASGKTKMAGREMKSHFSWGKIAYNGREDVTTVSPGVPNRLTPHRSARWIGPSAKRSSFWSRCCRCVGGSGRLLRSNTAGLTRIEKKGLEVRLVPPISTLPKQWTTYIDRRPGPTR